MSSSSSSVVRPSGRAANEIREVKFTRRYTMHAEGSVCLLYTSPSPRDED